ncbi:MAG: hypothetical protein ACI9RU_002636 [Litorivivens sp.]|jgi:hypothetical protein
MKSTLLVTYVLAFLCLAFGKVGNAQNCGNPSAVDYLDINNVRAAITNGQHVWESPDSNAGYEVPAGGGIHSLYAGSIWIGGLGPDQQLKIAGVTYGFDETDFYPGPLGDDALITAEQCEAWDRIWKLYRIQSVKHLAYFNCSLDPDCDPSEFNDYEIPEIFYEYPAHGDVGLGQDFYLAPFLDYNQDGIYNPEDGDCPLFEGMGNSPSDCVNCDELKGDCCLFWIDNDRGGFHTATEGESIGLEIHSMAYAYASSDVLNNTTFYSRKIINRGTQTLTDTYIGHWTDVDLGYSNDDFVQCDINRDLGFGINADSFDEQYGENPPVCGVHLMKGPLMDVDMIDNDEDGIVDNETLGMTNFMSYNNSNGTLGSPNQPLDYYNYLRSFFLDGSAMTCDGINATAWMFGYDSYDEADPCFGMTETTVQNQPGDQRFVMSSGPFTYEPGQSQCITHAVVWSDNPTAASNLEQQDYFLASVDSVKMHELNCFSCIPPSAEFIQIPNGDGYDFIPAYSNGALYSWSFGDGTESSFTCPTHVYDNSGDYEVCLVVTNLCEETSSSCTSIDVITAVEDDQKVVVELQYSIASNSITFVGGQTQIINLQLFDSNGKVVHTQSGNTNSPMTIPTLSAGIYVASVENAAGEHLLNEKLVIAQ